MPASCGRAPVGQRRCRPTIDDRLVPRFVDEQRPDMEREITLTRAVSPKHGIDGGGLQHGGLFIAKGLGVKVA